MEPMEAIEARISCRSYESREVEPEKLAHLQKLIDDVNADTGMHFQLYTPENPGYLKLSSAMFATQAPVYAALVAQDNQRGQEMVGYYGEMLVLLATQLGLGTCWVAGTYDHDSLIAEVGEGETVHDVVPIGYATPKVPLKQRTMRAGLRRRDRKLEAMFESDIPLEQAPAWIRAGIEAVRKGPSAVNEQPVVFLWDSATETLTTKVIPVKTTLAYTDLGIAKLHFEVAATALGVKGTWDWDTGTPFEVV